MRCPWESSLYHISSHLRSQDWRIVCLHVQRWAVDHLNICRLDFAHLGMQYLLMKFAFLFVCELYNIYLWIIQNILIQLCNICWWNMQFLLMRYIIFIWWQTTYIWNIHIVYMYMKFSWLLLMKYTITLKSRKMLACAARGNIYINIYMYVYIICIQL